MGTARVGLARSDGLGVLAVPLPAAPAGDAAVATVLSAIDEWAALEVYVGLPLHLSGQEGTSSALARAWAVALAERTMVPIRLIDERLSTVQAQRGLHDSGRSSRQSRALIDSASAVVFLQAALDQESRTGIVAGTMVAAASTEEGTDEPA